MVLGILLTSVIPHALAVCVPALTMVANTVPGDPTLTERLLGRTAATRLREKSNMSSRSPIAGMLVGTYGLPVCEVGLGKLSRLRTLRGATFQFRSINFRIDT